MNSILLAAAARLLTWLLTGFSLYMLLRGHNAPGGGFIAGLSAAAGMVLHSFAHGPDALRRLLRVEPLTLSALGFGLALLSAFGAALAGAEPMTGLWTEIAGIPVSTILVFDIGVFLTVFGAMMALLLALEEGQ